MLGSPFNTVPGQKVPERAWQRQFIRNYCDLVMIADHTEIELEDNGMRQTDMNFRQDIADTIRNIYEPLVGIERTKIIKGDKATRKATALSHVTNMFLSPVAA